MAGKKNEGALDLGALSKALKKAAGLEVEVAASIPSQGSWSSGLPTLDLALNGGIHYGRMLYWWGDSGFGKTAVALHLMAQFQRLHPRGWSILMDTEGGASTEFAVAVGCDPDRLWILRPKNIEEAFATMDATCTTALELLGPKNVFIAWDSLAATAAKATADRDYDEARIVGAQAASFSAGWQKFRPMIWKAGANIFCVNQVREKIGVMFGDSRHAPGGHSTGFYADQEVQLRLSKKLCEAKHPETAVGVETEYFVKKSRLGAPYRKGSFRVLFAGRVTDRQCLYETCKLYRVAESAGGYVIMNEERVASSIDEFQHKAATDPEFLVKILDTLRAAMFKLTLPDEQSLAAMPEEGAVPTDGRLPGA